MMIIASLLSVEEEIASVRKVSPLPTCHLLLPPNRTHQHVSLPDDYCPPTPAFTSQVLAKATVPHWTPAHFPSQPSSTV
jgi:hypothetical protein